MPIQPSSTKSLLSPAFAQKNQFIFLSFQKRSQTELESQARKEWRSKPKNITPYYDGKPSDPIGDKFREDAREILKLYKAAGTNMDQTIREMKEAITYDNPLELQESISWGTQYKCKGARQDDPEIITTVRKKLAAAGYRDGLFRLRYGKEEFETQLRQAYYKTCDEKFAERKNELHAAIETIAKEVYESQ